MRLYVIAAIVALVIAAAGGIYYIGMSGEKDRNRADQLEGTLNDAEKFNEGAGAAADVSWFERVFGTDAAD